MKWSDGILQMFMRRLGAQSTVGTLWNLYSISRLTMRTEPKTNAFIVRKNREKRKKSIVVT